jgi:hypothetical protein
MVDFRIAKSQIHFAENHFVTMIKSQKLLDQVKKCQRLFLYFVLKVRHFGQSYAIGSF